MHKTLQTVIAGGSLATLLLAGLALPAFAQTSPVTSLGLSASTTVSASVRGAGLGASITSEASIIAMAQQRADEEIARRITALNALSTRINEVQRLSSDEKNTLSASIQSQITLMNNLQAQIAADVQSNSTSSLKTDIQSITKSYRIYILIIPQGAIEAASDRALIIANGMSTISGQLQARIASSTDVSASVIASAEASLSDMNAKVADANTQATAANSEVESLMPDNGNQSVEQSNTAALKDARSKILASQQDFVTAREDALAIIKDLGIKISSSISAGASTTAQ